MCGGKIGALRIMPRATRMEHPETIRHGVGREDPLVYAVDRQDSLKK